MKTCLLFIVLVLGGCATPAQEEDPGVCISPEVLAMCALEGGCKMFTRQRFEQILKQVAEESCKGKT